MQDKVDWYAKRLRQVHMDFHMHKDWKGVLNDFDPAQIADNLKRAKVQVVKAFAKCMHGNSYYNTKVGHRHPAMKEDFLAAMIRECHAHDIGVIAHYSSHDGGAWSGGPRWPEEWVSRPAQAAEISVNSPDFPFCGYCANSPFTEEIVLPQMRELAEGYDLDGIFIDGANILFSEEGGCVCEFCRRKFKEQFGIELTPDLIKENTLYNQFVIESTKKFLADCTSVVKKIRPDMLFCANGCGNAKHPPQWIENMDFGVAEGPTYEPRGFDEITLQVHYGRTLGKPFEIVPIRNINSWGDFTLRPPATLKYEFSVIMANGGVISCGDCLDPKGKVDEAVYDVIGEVFTFMSKRDPFCIGAKSVKDIAVLKKQPAYNVFINESVRGTLKALEECHWQYDIIDELTLVSGLNEYRTLIVTLDITLTEEEAAAIDAFVTAGGNLICLRSGAQELGETLGVRFVGSVDQYEMGYIRPDVRIAKGCPDIPLKVQGTFYQVEPMENTEILAHWQYPKDGNAPGDYADTPAITIHNSGKGKTVYVAAPLMQSMWIKKHVWLKYILDNCLDLLISDRPYYLENVPSTVLTNLTTKNNELMLHLINFHAQRDGWLRNSTMVVEEIPPLFNIKVKIKTPNKPHRVSLEPLGEELSFTYKNGYAETLVPKLEIYDIVRVKLPAARVAPTQATPKASRI